MNETHYPGWSGNDYTLCGLALEAFESGDHVEPVAVTKPKERATCDQCLLIVLYCSRLPR